MAWNAKEIRYPFFIINFNYFDAIYWLEQALPPFSKVLPPYYRSIRLSVSCWNNWGEIWTEWIISRIGFIQTLRIKLRYYPYPGYPSFVIQTINISIVVLKTASLPLYYDSTNTIIIAYTIIVIVEFRCF